MGEFRFRVPADWKLDPYHANSIHVVGLDGIPWPCRIAVGDDPDEPETRKLLSVSRNRDESGKVYLIYPFKDRGEMLICTGTLPVREEPYDLLPELARGTLNRLRNQISIWEEGGLSIEKTVHDRVSVATKFVGEAILHKEPDQRTESSHRGIEETMDAVFELSQSFGKQISKFRREHDQLSDFWMCSVAGVGEQFDASRKYASCELLEMSLDPVCETQKSKLLAGRGENLGKRIIVGPWLDASIGGLSQALINADDYLARKDLLLIEGRKQLENLPSSTSLIHVVSGLNGLGHRHLSYPQQLQVAVDLLRLVDESRVELPTMVSFDFPWAERLAGAVGGVHPLQIADSLLRQGLPVSFLGLEINLDCWPNGSVVRDPLQWIDLVDVWAQLGLPLVLLMRVPTGGDDNAEVTQDRSVNHSRSNLTDKDRVEFLRTVLPMMVARPAVHGIIWQQWQDKDDKRFPRCGIVDENGNEKAIGRAIERVRLAIDG
ncbi:MAG: hypothetical protein AB8B55_21610 [Mariniblastus sp.]